MEKLPPRKRTTSLNCETTTTTLPPPPPLPQHQQKSESNKFQHSSTSPLLSGTASIPPLNANASQRENLPESIQYLWDYKTREKEFLKNLKETIANDCNIILKKEKELYKSAMTSTSTASSTMNLERENFTTISAAHYSNSSEITSIDSSSLSTFGLSAASSGASNKTSSSDDMTATMGMATKSLNQNISQQMPSISTSKMNEQQTPQQSEGDLLKGECEQFIMPLLNRTNSTISAVFAAYDAFEQLDNLHRLVDQMFKLEEQNYQMRKYIRDVKMLCELKKLQSKNYSNDLLNETGDLYDNELDLNNHSGFLNTILAAGNTASSKRNSSKRQNRERSKSVICNEVSKENLKVTSAPRRQSAYTSDASKAKVSKWTKVKAAFKWEKANAEELFKPEESSKLNSNQLKPVNNEVARYLRVPAPIPITGSSVDSILSSSIPATPATVSSASSMEDIQQPSEERRDSSKSDSRFETKSNNLEEENRRSRSLDSDMMAAQISTPTVKTKTPWKKVKNIIQTHSGSLKIAARSRSIKSTNSTGKDSRDVSPSEFIFDTLQQKSVNDSQQSPTQKLSFSNILSPSNSSTTANSQKGNSSGPNSPSVLHSSSGLMNLVGDDSGSVEMRPKASPAKPARKSKIISGFESLPEGMTIDITSSGINRPTPSPLNLSSKMESSDAELADVSYSPIILQKTSSKILLNRRHLTSAGNSSVPSSPSRHSEFFPEFESEDMSSGDFSEPTTPSRKLSDRLYYQMQQEEINERYLELREKLNKEFEAKRQEWEKMRLSCSSSSSSAYQLLQSNDLLQSSKSIPPTFLEENLSADFKKKLHKWRNKKSESSAVIIKDNLNSPPKGEKIDWHLWKTGQLKLEGQGLSPLPDQKSLPEEFQKKLEQWKKMKDTNTVPTYSSDNQNSLRRSSGKFGIGGKLHETTKKSKDDTKLDKEKLRLDREKLTKSHDKEKLEKLSKLRAIVAEPKAKEIEVQTSAGVMKFEGISRKFTRKLYEWEKAKGIGPESSTFAFLYPGYRAVATGNKSKEHRSHETSPNLGRSLSLDSISPIQSMPSVSHQPSCLSLNDVDEFRDDENLPGRTRRVSSNIELCQKHPFDENIREFADSIDERVMILGIPNKGKRLHAQKSFQIDDRFIDAELKPKSDLKQNDKTIEQFGKAAEILESFGNKPVDNIRNAVSVLTDLEKSIPELENRIERLNTPGKEAMNRVRKYVAELVNQCNELNQDEACCQELLDERTDAIENNLQNLQKNIIAVCKHAQIIPSETIIPKINVTSDDDKAKRISPEGHSIIPTKTNNKNEKYQLSEDEKSEFKVQISTQNAEALNVCSKTQQILQEFIIDASRSKISRNSSNGSRKKSRLRKIGSRQNSKTESESTDDEAVNSNEVTQRRLKRRLSRNKKSIDEDKSESNANEENSTSNNGAHVNENSNTVAAEDVVYVLKIKPGQPIEQSEICRQNEPSSKVLISPTETSVQLMTSASQENVDLEQQNIFVKTKRKIFTLVGRQPSENGSDSGIGPLAVSRDLDSSTTTEIPETEDSCRDSTSINSFPQLKSVKSAQSPILARRSALVENSKPIPSTHKELCPSIKLMIAKYNQKLETDRTSRSPLSSGTCTPSSIRSPVLERKIVKDQTNKYEENIEKVVKSASAGSIIPSKKILKVEISLENEGKNKCGRISKSFSLENISDNLIDDLQSNNIEPLAYDSLKNIKKSSETINNVKSEMIPKEHLFKKNKEKPNNLNVSKSGALRKIDLKYKAEHTWRRSSSPSETGDTSLEKFRNFPNKSDNTIPKITRKLENKATTPTEKSHPISAELWHPLLPVNNKIFFEQIECPKTPVNERAVKLALAKEEFLREIPSRSPSFRESSDTNKSDATWNNPRFSQTSFESEFSIDNGALQKCASAGMIKSSSNTTLEIVQDENNVDDSERYVSLPRSIARSKKFTSKLGFATLASKFRKAKKRRESREEPDNKMSAVSALCRQSLVLDVTQVSKEIQAKEETDSSAKASGAYTVVKSKSSHVGSFGTLFKSKDKNKDKNNERKGSDDKDSVMKSKSAILPHSSKDK